MIFAFSIAYIYIITEAVYVGVKSKNLLKPLMFHLDIRSFVMQYICCSAYIVLTNNIISMVFSDFLAHNGLLMVMIDLIIILSISNIEALKNKWFVFVTILVDVILLSINKRYINFIDIRALIIACVVLILRLILEKYNYKKIKTEDVTQGMVMSYISILKFSKSKVVGLPKYTSEDIQSRITKDEAESIKRWKNSKYGEETVTIVRKMPFAVFISIGACIYIIIRMCA